MAAMAAVLEEPRRTQTGRCVVIIGRLGVRNWLVAALLQEHLGCACQVRGIYPSSDIPVPRDAIALIDVEGISVGHVSAYVPVWQASGPYRCIALVNVDPASVQELAYLPAVRGIFVRHTSREHLLKGVRALMAGEYWLSRRILVEHFERTRLHVAAPARKADLTHKETETLRLLSGGYSNGDIARRLGVSSHTVKTHVYNLSRKLGVHNRVQAAKWAMENLAEPPPERRYAGGREAGRAGALPAAAGE